MIYILTAIHNRIEDTKEFLDCFKNQTHKDFKIFLVDDGSIDGSSEYISKNYPEITIFKGDGNLWWTGSVNLAIKEVIPQFKSRDFVLIINSDVTFEKDYLENLIKDSERNKRVIVGSLSKDYLNKKDIIDKGLKMDWKHYVYSSSPFLEGKNFSDDVDTLSTRGVLLPVEVIEKIGFLDEKHFPHYGSDYDYLFTAKENGFKLIVSYNSVIYDKLYLTGFRPQEKFLPYKKIWDKFFSIKSPSNFKIKIFMIWKHCPNLQYKIWRLSKFILGLPYIIIKNNFLYTLYKFRIIKLK
ncbi:hypothetical protein COV23_00030 [Candidatus Wolfebacteria bacterium CG10_big_fil_rev_8_21_14_0_10_31_9]|uniref:Glycosyltransferase 2-like domain-containing protein n=1 Tax=Candidatus Wolfebacteria bacterium CG10_big_fil_rev_8_21_14_0_10_31_9 TaxID=1975070 RepID=A0A2H0RDE5_9BACT|nr:MAG: hypothetical protein COV23_00030 [Candidatus Wolfebacteria bacterium CG10_big_fil_rev_8_21_14_0_10_31_9]